jgi:hypothetical protein
MGDLLFELTNWLRTTFLLDFALWTADTPLSQLMVTHFWAIPIVQVFHILALSAAFGSILMINARLLGIAGHARTVAETSARYIPWMWWSLVVLIISGFLMIAGEPVREMINPIFWIKMFLVIFAIVISIWFHKGVLHQIAADQEIGATAKATAVFLVLLWCVIMFCGRWIAYAPV